MFVQQMICTYIHYYLNKFVSETEVLCIQLRYYMQLRSLRVGISAFQPLNSCVTTSHLRFVGLRRCYTVLPHHESKYAEKLRIRAEE